MENSTTTQQVPTDTQSTQPPRSRGRKAFSIILRLAFYALVISVAIFAVLAFCSFRACFNKNCPDDQMRGRFNQFRFDSSDKLLKESLKRTKTNQYDEDAYHGYSKKFFDVAQNNSKDSGDDTNMLLHDLTPLHCPRGGVIHFSFFNMEGDYKNDLESFYAQRREIRRYAGDDEYLEERKGKTDEISFEDFKVLQDKKETRMFSKNPVKIKGKEEPTGNKILKGEIEPSMKDIKAKSFENIRENDDKLKVFYKNDFQFVMKKAGTEDRNKNILAYLEFLQTDSNKGFQFSKKTQEIKKENFEEIAKSSSADNKELIEKLSVTLNSLYGKIAPTNHFYDYRFKDDKKNNSAHLGYNTHKFLVSMGSGNPTAVHSLLYSQMFIYFYYGTLNHKFDKVVDEKLESTFKEPIVRVAHAFTYLNSLAFKATNREEYKKNVNFFNRLINPNMMLEEDKDHMDFFKIVKKDAADLLKVYKDNVTTTTSK